MNQNKWSKVVVILGVIAITGSGIYSFIFGEAGYLKRRQLEREVDHLEKEIIYLRSNNAETEKKRKELTEDPAASEKIARDKYGMTMPGEIIVKFPEE
ncbi:MAG: septum formation initiator family protein [bacterium]